MHLINILVAVKLKFVFTAIGIGIGIIGIDVRESLIVPFATG